MKRTQQVRNGPRPIATLFVCVEETPITYPCLLFYHRISSRRYIQSGNFEDIAESCKMVTPRLPINLIRG